MAITLQGRRLINTMIAVAVCPAYILLGYNNAVFGGLLTLPSFLETFPGIDTVGTVGGATNEHARVQGESSFVALPEWACGGMLTMRSIKALS